MVFKLLLERRAFKNPSLVEIRNYFNKYYVPNNMGIILSGDFNADEVIAKIDKTFGQMQTKPFQNILSKQEALFQLQ
jgi:predicted Zn-dependent peptidase